jgi:hypothetical protein
MTEMSEDLFVYRARCTIDFVSYWYNQDGEVVREIQNYGFHRDEDEHNNAIWYHRERGGFEYNPAPHHGPIVHFIPWHQIVRVVYAPVEQIVVDSNGIEINE